MILYHFPTSPVSRRVRLALALKALPVELRDARAVPEHRATVNRLNPMHTVPVLVDEEDDAVVFDSTAICHYLDRKFPDPPLWPAGMAGAEAFQITALADAVSNILSDCGMRYHALHQDPAFPDVSANVVGRAQRALDELARRAAARAGEAPLCGDRWGGADIALYCLITWLEGLPGRAANFPPAGWVAALGWTLPPELTRWADQHRSRPDVLAL
ncbi:MAG TPA: glutathione S-transferase family protein [Polyangiaceae bacterium]|nr:glutathione S-transferase family protein [Polyangiaceae bacterium]